MVNIPFFKSDWRRESAGEPYLPLRNRYWEANPVNRKEGTSLIARPALKRFTEVGDGPIRALFSEPGSFGGALFVVSGEELYRLDTDNSATMVRSGIAGNPASFPSIAITGAIGPGTPEMCYVADGQTLWLYMQNGFAQGVLTATGTILSGETFELNGMYYRWTSGSVDAGSPAGTLANPWLVALGLGNAEALENARGAINADGSPGISYSTAVTPNAGVTARSSTATTLRVQAEQVGTSGNGITTTETGANIAWGGATLSGGGAPSTTSVDIPDALSPIAVVFILSFVVVIINPAGADGFNGRFFWIEPGETFIRPLNFATAERSPDPVQNARVVGDQLWLLGTKTTEVWYLTGNEDIPFMRVQGQLFDRGTVEGTDAQIKDTIILVDSDGTVYAINGGGAPSRISDNSVEERIRKALKLERVL